MRCALQFAVGFVGIVMTVNNVMAQTSYNPPMANSGLVQRRGLRLPPVTPHLSQQTPAHAPVGSGVPASMPTGQSLQGTIGRASLTASQFPALPTLPRGYPTPPSATHGYAVPATPAAGYRAPQRLAPTYRSPQPAAPVYSPPQRQVPGYPAPGYSVPPGPVARNPANSVPANHYPMANPYAAPRHSGVPDRTYRGAPVGYDGNSSISTPSGRLFEASASDASSLHSPVYQMRWQGSSIQEVPPEDYTIQEAGPGQEIWTTQSDCGTPGCTHKNVGRRSSSSWFAAANALLMTRDRENNVWLSYDTDDIRSRGQSEERRLGKERRHRWSPYHET